MKDHRITKRGGLKSFAWLLLILAGRKNVKLCPLSGWLAENYFHPYSAGTSELVGNKVNARFLSEVEQSECKVGFRRLSGVVGRVAPAVNVRLGSVWSRLSA